MVRWPPSSKRTRTSQRSGNTRIDWTTPQLPQAGCGHLSSASVGCGDACATAGDCVRARVESFPAESAGAARAAAWCRLYSRLGSAAFPEGGFGDEEGAGAVGVAGVGAGEASALAGGTGASAAETTVSPGESPISLACARAAAEDGGGRTFAGRTPGPIHPIRTAAPTRQNSENPTAAAIAEANAL